MTTANDALSPLSPPSNAPDVATPSPSKPHMTSAPTPAVMAAATPEVSSPTAQSPQPIPVTFPTPGNLSELRRDHLSDHRGELETLATLPLSERAEILARIHESLASTLKEAER